MHSSNSYYLIVLSSRQVFGGSPLSSSEYEFVESAGVAVEVASFLGEYGFAVTTSSSTVK